MKAYGKTIINCWEKLQSGKIWFNKVICNKKGKKIIGRADITIIHENRDYTRWNMIEFYLFDLNKEDLDILGNLIVEYYIFNFEIDNEGRIKWYGSKMLDANNPYLLNEKESKILSDILYSLIIIDEKESFSWED